MNKESLMPINKYATYKDFMIFVKFSIDNYYYVCTSGQALPHNLFIEFLQTGRGEYTGKIKIDDPDLQFTNPELIHKIGKYKNFRVFIRAHDSKFYYVSSQDINIPQDLFLNGQYIAKDYYYGKVLKTDENLKILK